MNAKDYTNQLSRDNPYTIIHDSTNHLGNPYQSADLRDVWEVVNFIEAPICTARSSLLCCLTIRSKRPHSPENQ
ncbi:hypothetical protein RCL_jg15339.t1 [Rhizophagus clarus]|uniref:Uncharacterized protein n=1 Tax=Rhizophagus clarus TaxID=94130 RepID=A0A8H3KRC9_9GLOM|nr:hypothetical protein RCL_jg15339.t1 [Rhizophagus clarus]